MRRTLGNIFGRVTAPLLVAVLVAGGLALQAPRDSADVAEAQPVARHPGPGPLPAVRRPAASSTSSWASTARHRPSRPRSASSPRSSRPSTATTVAIDHWEDGYDADPIGQPGRDHRDPQPERGRHPHPRQLRRILIGSMNPGDIPPHYDGGDKIVSTGALVVTVGGWPTNATTLARRRRRRARGRQLRLRLRRPCRRGHARSTRAHGLARGSTPAS